MSASIAVFGYVDEISIICFMSASIESTGMGINSNYMNFVLYGLPLWVFHLS